MYENYLAHYGVLGMRWRTRRLEKKIKRISADNKRKGTKGNPERLARLRQKLADHKTIRDMDVVDKIFLTRQGALASARLKNRGVSRAKRLISLHGLGMAKNMATTAASKALVGENKFSDFLTKTPKEIATSNAKYIGINAAVDILGYVGLNSVYKRIR